MQDHSAALPWPVIDAGRHGGAPPVLRLGRVGSHLIQRDANHRESHRQTCAPDG